MKGEKRLRLASIFSLAWILAADVTDRAGVLVIADGGRIYLPLVYVADNPWSDPVLADLVWEAIDALEGVAPPEISEAMIEPPSAAGASAAVNLVCLDFPDLPDHFGPGAHRRACDVWTAGHLALFHVVRTRRSGIEAALTADEHGAWAGHFLDQALDGLAEFVYGSSDGPPGLRQGFRDTRAAVWQNPLRTADLAIVVALLREAGVMTVDREARVVELFTAVARAWHSHFWSAGQLPGATLVLTTGTAAEFPAWSVAGFPVASEQAHSFVWDPDHGNSPAEEMAWLGAGVLLSMRVASKGLLDDERAMLIGAAEHYLGFALAMDRPDPILGGVVRTLNAEISGGDYGKSAYWIENHQPDMPSLPYLFSTWHYLGAGVMGATGSRAAPWPALEDAGAWDDVIRSAEATLHAPDGSLLVDLSLGGRLGYAMDDFPSWTMPCAQHRAGAQYVQWPSTASGGLWVSEVGHPAGPGLLAAALPLMRLAAARGDAVTFTRWRERAVRTAEELSLHPPPLEAAQCRVAPWVPSSPAFHWGGMMSSLVLAALHAEGWSVPFVTSLCP